MPLDVFEGGRETVGPGKARKAGERGEAKAEGAGVGGLRGRVHPQAADGEQVFEKSVAYGLTEVG